MSGSSDNTSRLEENSPSAVIALSAEEIRQFFPENKLARLRSLLPAGAWFDPTQASPAEWNALLRRVKPQIVVSAWRTPPLLADESNVRYVCHVVGSVRGVVPRELLVRGVKVTNWGGIAAPFVAEQALLLVLGSLRSLPRWASFMSDSFNHEDKNHLETQSLRGRRVAIHGFGQIARELIKLLQPFDCSISAFSVGVPDAFIKSHGAQPAETLAALAADADILISCEALTDKSRGSIGRDVLSKLKPGATFVNVGRGAIVDEAALAEVALERQLRVASDVFTEEPLPPTSPMRKIPNALFSPHIGGPTLDRYRACGDMAVQNIDCYLRGAPLFNEVTLELYDRST